MRLLVIVCSCKKYGWKVAKQQEWLKTMPLPYLIFTGNPAQDNEYSFWPPYLSVKHADHYESMPGKLLKAMLFAANWDFDYLLKVDDDVFLHTQALSDIRVCSDYLGVVRHAEMVDRTWHYGKVHDPALDKSQYTKVVQYDYCGGGVGYFLSRRAFDVFLRHADPVEADSWIFEDVYVGQVLGRNGILAVPLDMKSLTVREWVSAEQ